MRSTVWRMLRASPNGTLLVQSVSLICLHYVCPIKRKRYIYTHTRWSSTDLLLLLSTSTYWLRQFLLFYYVIWWLIIIIIITSSSSTILWSKPLIVLIYFSSRLIELIRVYIFIKQKVKIMTMIACQCVMKHIYTHLCCQFFRLSLYSLWLKCPHFLYTNVRSTSKICPRQKK